MFKLEHGLIGTEERTIPLIFLECSPVSDLSITPDLLFLYPRPRVDGFQLRVGTVTPGNLSIDFGWYRVKRTPGFLYYWYHNNIPNLVTERVSFMRFTTNLFYHPNPTYVKGLDGE